MCFSLLKMHSLKWEKHMGFSTAECTFAARQDFSNLFSGFHLNCTIHLLPTTKITTWFDETFVCRVKSLQFKNLQMYTYSCLLTKHTSAQERAKKGYKRQGKMLKVGFCCFKKLELNTKCKYSNTAMQKTYPYAFKLFTSFKLLLVNVYQEKYCKALPQMFCCKDIFLACQPLIFILEINHNPKSNYQLSSHFYHAMWLCFFSHWMPSQVTYEVSVFQRSKDIQEFKWEATADGKICQWAVSNARTLWKVAGTKDREQNRTKEMCSRWLGSLNSRDFYIMHSLLKIQRNVCHIENK